VHAGAPRLLQLLNKRRRPLPLCKLTATTPSPPAKPHLPVCQDVPRQRRLHRQQRRRRDGGPDALVVAPLLELGEDGGDAARRGGRGARGLGLARVGVGVDVDAAPALEGARRRCCCCCRCCFCCCCCWWWRCSWWWRRCRGELHGARAALWCAYCQLHGVAWREADGLDLGLGRAQHAVGRSDRQNERRDGSPPPPFDAAAASCWDRLSPCLHGRGYAGSPGLLSFTADDRVPG
jgi:hypothetical protein